MVRAPMHTEYFGSADNDLHSIMRTRACRQRAETNTGEFIKCLQFKRWNLLIVFLDI